MRPPALTTLSMAAFLLIAAAPARGAVTNLTVVQTDNSAELVGMVTNDLYVDVAGRIGLQQMAIELDSGEFYHTYDVGGDVAPNPTFVTIVPELAFDTFVAVGGFLSDTSEDTGIFGGAINVGGYVGATLSGSEFSVAWTTNVGVDITDRVDLPVARITLSDDATGRVSYLGTTLTDNRLLWREMTISGGVIGPPLPSAFGGDFNGDYAVDNNDLNLLLASWGDATVPPEWVNGFTPPVDNGELTTMLGNWGFGYGPSIAVNESGDFDGDGSVDNSDLGFLLGNWGMATVPPAWVNGFIPPVDYVEANALLANWGFGTSSSTSVPEPTGAVMLALLVVSAAAAPRRCG